MKWLSGPGFLNRVGGSMWQWGKRHITSVSSFAAGTGLATGILVLAALVGARDVKQAHDPEKVARDWRSAMLALGIDPVFPPSEDLRVGDIIAVDDGKQSDPSGPATILFRSMRIAHVPGTEAALQKAYKDLPQFPPTPEKYDGTSPVAAEGDIFTAPAVLKTLPIVAFPGITLATASAETVGLGVLSGIRSIFSGATRATSESVQIRIPEAETYGLLAADAMDLLVHFCRPGDKPLEQCSERGVRLLLSSLQADVLYPKDQKKMENKLPSEKKQTDLVGLLFINRIYLIRSIDYVYGSDTVVATAIRGKSDGTTKAEKSTSAPYWQVPTGAQTSQQALELARAQDHEVGALNQGGQLATATITSEGVVLKKQFTRPVAIGYSAIKIGPFDDGKVVQKVEAGG